MRIVLTGGGTCGHIMPNIAILPYLKEKFDSVAYIGSADSMEERIAKEHDIPFYSTDTIKLERTKIWRNLKIPYVLTSAVFSAKELLKILKPDVVFSKGGYVSLPTCLAAKSLNIPYVIHESDSTLGVANKFVSGRAAKIILSTPDNKYLEDRFVVLGNPIRDEIINGNRNNIGLKLDKSKKNLLIVGGSLGALAINGVIAECADKLVEKYNVIHIHGKNYTPNFADYRYFPLEFVSNIGDFYAAADVIISRAGAGAISEINAVGKRCIYAPLPKGNSRGDQEDNAKLEEKKNRAIVISQDNFNPEKLITALKNIELMPIPRPLYDKDTSKKITEVILSAVGNRTISC